MNATESITCPAEGDKILAHYRSYYESVFIIFHPFIKPKIGFEFDHENDYPDKKSIVENFDKVTWLEMVQECGFEDLNRLDIALRNWIGGLVAKYQNQVEVDKLENVCKQFKIIEPGEGRFSDCLIDEMISSVKNLGYNKIIFGDEWGKKKEALLIADIEFKKEDFDSSIDFIPNNMYTEDKKLLYSVHWDSHFTLLCSDLETLKSIVDKYQFEGFYANNETEIYWSVKD